MNQPLSESQKATNADTFQHIDLVMRLLASAQIELMRRQFTHDRSKLAAPEVDVFTEVTPKLAKSTYGSEEYFERLKEMKPALDHHYGHNRHHPEFFKDVPKDEQKIKHYENSIEFLDYMGRHPYLPDDVWGCRNCSEDIENQKKTVESNINGMNLFDLIEMIVDWYAATKRHNDGDIHKSLEINKERFGISDQLQRILENTVPWITDEFESYKTQLDLKPPARGFGK